MEQIGSDGRRTFFLRALQPGEALDPPFGGAPYPALVWGTDRTTAEQKDRLCTSLIATGCRWVVCAGRESVAWEEAADEAFTTQDLTDDEFRERMVMTSSHQGYTPDEVAFDFVHITGFGSHDFTRYLVLLIGDDAHVREQLVSSIRGEAGAVRG
jgi:2-polyprenyl-6-methoxyphenol hydroxylase-like FAD-dependent oxidoreductase